jgi:hypothetical protein
MIVDAKVLLRFSDEAGEKFELWVRDHKGDASVLSVYDTKLDATRALNNILASIVDKERGKV